MKQPASQHEADVVGELPPIDISYWQTYLAGRISQCLGQWREIPSDRHILQLVQAMKIEFDDIPKGRKLEHPDKFSPDEWQYLQSEIQNLLHMKVVKKMGHTSGEVISPIFLVPKEQAGKFGMILNLKKLNWM